MPSIAAVPCWRRSARSRAVGLPVRLRRVSLDDRRTFQRQGARVGLVAVHDSFWFRSGPLPWTVHNPQDALSLPSTCSYPVLCAPPAHTACTQSGAQASSGEFQPSAYLRESATTHCPAGLLNEAPASGGRERGVCAGAGPRRPAAGRRHRQQQPASGSSGCRACRKLVG